MSLRSPYDREILSLALPALGALAAEPLYLLADTAMVGHLGTQELAALAIAGALIVGAFTLFNFLTYGTTAQVARLHGERAARASLRPCFGAGEEDAAGRIAAQALWLSAAIGLARSSTASAGGWPARRGRRSWRRPVWGRPSSAPCSARRPTRADRRSLACGRWRASAVRSSCAPVRSTARSWWPARCSRALGGGLARRPPDRLPAVWGMLAASLGVYVPIALGSLALGLGIVGVWAGLVGLIVVRLATCAWRFRGRRWALVGASRVAA